MIQSSSFISRVNQSSKSVTPTRRFRITDRASQSSGVLWLEYYYLEVAVSDYSLCESYFACILATLEILRFVNTIFALSIPRARRSSLETARIKRHLRGLLVGGKLGFGL